MNKKRPALGEGELGGGLEGDLHQYQSLIWIIYEDGLDVVWGGGWQQLVVLGEGAYTAGGHL